MDRILLYGLMLAALLLSGCVEDKECREWAEREVCVKEDAVELKCIHSIRFQYNLPTNITSYFMSSGSKEYIVDESAEKIDDEWCLRYSLHFYSFILNDSLKFTPNYHATAFICSTERQCDWAKKMYWDETVACFVTLNCTIDELDDHVYAFPALTHNKTEIAIALHSPNYVKRCVETEKRFVCVDVK